MTVQTSHIITKFNFLAIKRADLKKN